MRGQYVGLCGEKMSKLPHHSRGRTLGLDLGDIILKFYLFMFCTNRRPKLKSGSGGQSTKHACRSVVMHGNAMMHPEVP